MLNKSFIKNEDYVKEFGNQENPVDFINWIKENNYTLEIWYELFEELKSCVSFHGNLKECSCPFKYKIYNNDMVNELQSLIENKNINQYYFRTYEE